MIKSVSGTLTLKTDKFSSKITIPAKSSLDVQVRNLLYFVEEILKQNGDSDVTKEFAKRLLRLEEDTLFSARDKINRKIYLGNNAKLTTHKTSDFELV